MFAYLNSDCFLAKYDITNLLLVLCLTRSTELSAGAYTGLVFVSQAEIE